MSGLGSKTEQLQKRCVRQSSESEAPAAAPEHAEKIGLNMETMPFILHVAVLVCAFACIVSICVAFYAQLLVYSRTWKPGDQAKERELGWGERAGRQASRFNEFLVADEFRLLRRLVFGAYAAAFGSFVLLSLFAALLKQG